VVSKNFGANILKYFKYVNLVLSYQFNTISSPKGDL